MNINITRTVKYDVYNVVAVDNKTETVNHTEFQIPRGEKLKVGMVIDGETIVSAEKTGRTVRVKYRMPLRAFCEMAEIVDEYIEG